MTFIDPLFAFFAVGTFGFWIFWTVISIWILIELENRSSYFVHGFVSLGLLLLIYNEWSAITWTTVVLWIGGYAIAGGVWSVFKWWRFNKELLHATKQTINGLYAAKELEKQKNIQERISVVVEELKKKLNPINNRGRIIGWITYWPWSVFWTLFRDLFRTIFDSLVNCYTAISSRSIRELDKHTNTKIA